MKQSIFTNPLLGCICLVGVSAQHETHHNHHDAHAHGLGQAMEEGQHDLHDDMEMNHSPDEGEHAGHVMEADSADMTGILSDWTTYIATTNIAENDDTTDYWLVGKYATRVDEAGSYFFDFVT